ncbi:DUF1543 domain-containing protein [Acinetobacter lwoffii]|uniref:DUF1543 domain-containing protein n=1 Tax=Acinetobacter lwoffii TaxID=28090 RepID=A0AAW8AV63_ACILW|nr:DUF1543 domain-containing protein [Acinetobacter lwoffii]MDP1369545.1 DUF1543 domain-containing protein [Acinetobacter lwoffii]MDP1388944.1 DUF1543 domain-containing protein [Acinetobacter lwoffii]MDP1446684.1 DUF1543 domain-containing protein [Acinetobacter lwoffii]
MPSLFIVMLGGRHARANTEVHDVVLAVGESLEDTYPQLKNAWFAEQKGLHIDAWVQIKGLEFEGKSYVLQFTDAQPQQSDEKLWLINLGGYDPREFGELHRYVLVVAQNAMVAKQRGKAYFARHWQKQHTDRVLDVDDCIAIDQVYGHYVQLLEGSFSGNRWENTYLTI